jgi:hypothetical protein
MFIDHQILRYFNRIGFLKERNLEASLGEDNGRSADVVSIGAIRGVTKLL